MPDLPAWAKPIDKPANVPEWANPVNVPQPTPETETAVRVNPETDPKNDLMSRINQRISEIPQDEQKVIDRNTTGDFAQDMLNPISVAKKSSLQVAERVINPLADIAGMVVAEAANTFIPDSVKEGAKNIIAKLADTQGGKDVGVVAKDVSALASWVKENHPDSAVAGEALLNMGGLVGGGRVAKEAIDVAGDVSKVTGRGVGRAVLFGKTPEKIYKNNMKFVNPKGMKTHFKKLDEDKIIKTLLDEKIPISENGYNKLIDRFSELNDDMGKAIAPHADKPLNARKVSLKAVDLLEDTSKVYDSGAARDSIIGEINKFLGNHEGSLTVGTAHEIKKDIYKQLQTHYQQTAIGTSQYTKPQVDAMKAIARGLKDQVAKNVKEARPINDALSRVIDAEKHMRNTVFSGQQADSMFSLGNLVLATNPKVGIPAILAKTIAKSKPLKSNLALAQKSMRDKPLNSFTAKTLGNQKGSLADDLNDIIGIKEPPYIQAKPEPTRIKAIVDHVNQKGLQAEMAKAQGKTGLARRLRAQLRRERQRLKLVGGRAVR